MIKFQKEADLQALERLRETLVAARYAAAEAESEAKELKVQDIEEAAKKEAFDKLAAAKQAREAAEDALTVAAEDRQGHPFQAFRPCLRERGAKWAR